MNLRERILERSLVSVDELDQPVELGSGQAGTRAAHVFLVQSDNRLLLQVTGANHRNPYRIGSSVAGFVYSGETYLEAASRRCREELGVSPDLRKVGNVRSPDSGGFKFSEIYVAQAPTSASVAAPGHVDALLSLSREEIRDLLVTEPGRFTPTFPYVFPLIDRYLSTRPDQSDVRP